MVDEDADVGAEHKARIQKLNTEIARVQRLARNVSDPAIQTPLKEIETSKKSLASRERAVRAKALERLGRVGPDGEDLSVRGLRDRVGMLEELGKGDASDLRCPCGRERRDQPELALHRCHPGRDRARGQCGQADWRGTRSADRGTEGALRVQPLESADAPRKEEDKRISMASLAGLGTFGMFILGVAFLEFRTRRISSIDEVTRSWAPR